MNSFCQEVKNNGQASSFRGDMDSDKVVVQIRQKVVSSLSLLFEQ